jgi:hypothetical protein
LFENQPEASPRSIYLLHRQDPDKWALRYGDWKVVYYGKSEPKSSSWQLFNLTEDPAEQHNVAAEYPETVLQLHQQFLAHREKDRKAPNYPFTPLEYDPSQEPWLAKYTKQKNAPTPSEQLINTDEEPNLLRSGFKSLFNGLDLTGWTPRGGTCTFEARDGAIVGTCVPGSDSTYLCSDRSDFKNFIFTCDIYWHIDSNTGVQFRGQVRTDSKGREVVFGPQAEMEGFEKDRGWSGGIYGQSCGGYFYPLWLKQHARARKALRKNDWNRITVSADKGVVKTWINGVPAAHWIDDGTYREGFFGLQIHKGQQGQVSFRNIRVKELK